MRQLSTKLAQRRRLRACVLCLWWLLGLLRMLLWEWERDVYPEGRMDAGSNEDIDPLAMLLETLAMDTSASAYSPLLAPDDFDILHGSIAAASAVVVKGPAELVPLLREPRHNFVSVVDRYTSRKQLLRLRRLILNLSSLPVAASSGALTSSTRPRASCDSAAQKIAKHSVQRFLDSRPSS